MSNPSNRRLVFRVSTYVWAGLATWQFAGCSAPDTGPPGPPRVRAATKAEREALIDSIKSLQGDWNSLDSTGKEVLTSQFRVTAGGSAVREVLFPGQPEELTNVYHMDGADLVVTRYCALGNQPRLRAAQGKLKGVIEFRLDEVTDWSGPHEPYMGALVVRVLDPDHVIFDWSRREAGQVSGHMELDLRRRK